MVPINELPVDARLLAEHSPAGGRSLPYLRGRLKSPLQQIHGSCQKSPASGSGVGRLAQRNPTHYHPPTAPRGNVGSRCTNPTRRRSLP